MNYAQIRERDISNGEGIRVSLFVSGCGFHCYNCFNGEYQDWKYGELYTNETELYILELISKDYISGLSLLGGDLFYQDVNGLSQVLELFKKVKQLNKTIWVWTGFLFEDLAMRDELTELLKYIDVLIDGQYIDELKDLRLYMRGSSNQRVIDAQKSLETGGVALWKNGNYS